MIETKHFEGVSRAWSWSKTHSPLLLTARWLVGMIHRQAHANSIIQTAGVPDPIAERIERITRRTRLWPSERADIARELCTHAQDALDADHDTEGILTTLGDPKLVGNLLRRSAKRKRHWLWQAHHRASQAVLATLGVMFTLYAILFVRFNTGSPDIKRNYIAELNQRNAAYTENQRAWPEIEALWAASSAEGRRLHEAKTAEDEVTIRQGEDPLNDAEPRHLAYDMGREATPEHIGYDEYRDFIDQLKPLIDNAARAARLPTIGGLYSDRSELVTLEGTDTRAHRPLPYSADPAETESMIGVQLPWLGQARTVANIFNADATFAAASGDADRAADRTEAALLLAGLVSDERFLISTLLGIAIQQEAEQSFLQMLHDHPDLFTESQLVALSHRIAAVSARTQVIDMSIERQAIDDILQRVFTDDGHGDGRITASGFEQLLDEILPVPGYRQSDDLFGENTKPTALGRVIGPIALLTVATRAEHRDLYRHLMDIIQLGIDAPTAEISLRYLEEFQSEFMRTVGQSDAYPVLRVMMPALDKSVHTMHLARARTGATLIIIAAHIHHRRTGVWPTAAEQLIPQLLPEPPQDPFNPGQPLKVLVRDGQLFVYSVGTDGDDDQATPDPRETQPFDRHAARSLSNRYRPTGSSADVPNADWILYPPQP